MAAAPPQAPSAVIGESAVHGKGVFLTGTLARAGEVVFREAPLVSYQQVGSMLDATRGSPLWRRPRPHASPIPARSSAAASGDGGAALFDKTSSRGFGSKYDRTPPRTPPLLGDLVELKHDSQIIYARVAERRATSRPAPRAVWHAVFEK